MGDPYDDFDRHTEDDYRWEQRRPVCVYCGEHIVNERCYEMDNHDLVCPECLEDYLKANQDIMLELAMERADEWYEVYTNDKMED